MEIIKEKNGNMLSISLSGRLDAIAASDLDKIIKNDLNDTAFLVFDMKNLSYMASAGLRVLLSAQKIMNKKGSMKLTHVNDEVMDVLEMTGFLRFISIEK